VDGEWLILHWNDSPLPEGQNPLLHGMEPNAALVRTADLSGFQSMTQATIIRARILRLDAIFLLMILIVQG